MKKIFTLLLSTLVLIINAQLIEDSTSTGTGYTTQSFYSLENGEIANEDNTNWDISFSMSGNGADGSAIWLNELNGDLWASPGDTSTWASFDTTGYSTWKHLYNSDEAYKNGAFNKHRGMGPNGTFDMGWGYLNPSNNFWTFGDSLYLWKSANNNFKKIWIVSLKSGTFIFKYANLDGSNLVQDTIKKSDYPKRNFVYYSLQNNTIIDREPDNDTWDLTFLGQKDDIGFMVLKPVLVFQNRNTWTAKAYKSSYTEATETDEAETSFTKQINNIGREWKKFHSGVWTIHDTIAYFVYDQDSVDLYRIVFTDFEGSATGKAHFVKEKIVIDTANAINEMENMVTYAVYPNPAQDMVSVFVNMEKAENYTISLYNISGQVVVQKQVEKTNSLSYNNIDISSLEDGMYFIRIEAESFHAVKRLLVKS